MRITMKLEELHEGIRLSLPLKRNNFYLTGSTNERMTLIFLSKYHLHKPVHWCVSDTENPIRLTPGRQKVLNRRK